MSTNRLSTREGRSVFGTQTGTQAGTDVPSSLAVDPAHAAIGIPHALRLLLGPRSTALEETWFDVG